MSNLVPTPRTDKNGRTVIRHMKTFFSKDQKTLPTIPPIAQPSSNHDPKQVSSLIRDYLLALPDFHIPIPASEVFDNAIEKLHENSPETLTTIQRLMSGGTENGKEAVACYLLDEVKGARYGVSDISIAPKHLEAKLLERWNAENVAHEAGLSGQLDFSRKSRIMTTPKSGYTDAEWRGHAAFRLAFETTEVKPEFGPRNLMEFISWAGRHNDIARVIELARERKTMDPQVIQSLMEDEVSRTVLRDGLL